MCLHWACCRDHLGVGGDVCVVVGVGVGDGVGWVGWVGGSLGKGGFGVPLQLQAAVVTRCLHGGLARVSAVPAAPPVRAARGVATCGAVPFAQPAPRAPIWAAEEWIQPTRFHMAGPQDETVRACLLPGCAPVPCCCHPLPASARPVAARCSLAAAQHH